MRARAGPGSGRVFLAMGLVAAMLVIPGLFLDVAPLQAPTPEESPAGAPESGPVEESPVDACFPGDPPGPPGAGRTVYLTFDDGPSEVTLDVLDILQRYRVPATFFVCGNRCQFGRSAYRRMVDEGHAIGNHSYSHDFSRVYASAEAFWEDFEELQDLLQEATGYRPRIMRFPGGSNTGHARRELMDKLMAGLEERGYHYFDWNVCSGDSAVLTQDPEVIIRRVLDGVRGLDEAIVLFHDSQTRTTTAEALPVILEALLAGGFEFRTLTPHSSGARFPR